MQGQLQHQDHRQRGAEQFAPGERAVLEEPFERHQRGNAQQAPGRLAVQHRKTHQTQHRARRQKRIRTGQQTDADQAEQS